MEGSSSPLDIYVMQDLPCSLFRNAGADRGTFTLDTTMGSAMIVSDVDECIEFIEFGGNFQFAVVMLYGRVHPPALHIINLYRPLPNSTHQSRSLVLM